MAIAALIIVAVVLVGSTLIASVLVQRRADRAIRSVAANGGPRDGRHQPDEVSERLQRGLRSHLSHELRTPLNSIITLSQLLIEDQNGKLTPEQRQYIEVIRRSGRSLLGLIDQLAEGTAPGAAPGADAMADAMAVDATAVPLSEMEAEPPAAGRVGIMGKWRPQPRPEPEPSRPRLPPRASSR